MDEQPVIEVGKGSREHRSLEAYLRQRLTSSCNALKAVGLSHDESNVLRGRIAENERLLSHLPREATP